ncbi:Outer membrane protein assembly factor BamB, contains PQQ-like beta-propeller repeat [Neorhodopirellula lusitana]|uniref:Outer membrane protein assembly factor BamB, contains PQQ-like beta-propeller repeat n=1 Tax=Neorhodopirellula lusitana TaxID=445327 RepID=A0ABY1QSB3_9BACT|nr:PQQ-binding-like beta-propeller repeat protein [Neorhodopirellula lusitana]SMP78792.1 Outer membrane protein assembly factor BamB, contains PQQ-like beta-propeller repeat [Neorhodopirellula lusitana]
MTRLSFIALFAIGLLASLVASAPNVLAQWPDRHGPSHDGVVADADAEGLPIHWTDTENVAWKAPLHDEGHSSPVIADGKIWLTTATTDGKKQFVIAIDEQTGEILHDRLLFENAEVEKLGGAVGFNNYAAPSCVLGPSVVYVHFGSYGTAKLDAKTAEVIWQRRDLPCRHFRGPGSSPVLYGNKLVLTFDGVDQQYTTALDAETGQTLWRTDRTTDYEDLGDDGKPLRDGDMRKAYCTPAIVPVGDQLQILSVGARAMQSYDLETGDELWTLRHKSYNAGIRPLWIPEEKLAIINTGSRGAQLLAVRLDASTKGDVTDSHVEWVRERGNPRFAKPIQHDGLIFQVTDNGVVSCIELETGDELWKKRISGDYLASPILAGDRLYFFNQSGLGTVVKAQRDPEVIAVNDVPGMATTACPAVSSGAIFVRGKEHLYKIQSP